MSGDKNMCEAFNNGEDIHKQAASKVLNKPIEEITKEVGIFGGVPEIPTLFFDYAVAYSTII